MNNSASCPRRIRDTIEIAPEYLEFLMPMLKDGMPISNILFVPTPPYQTDRKEYVLVVYKDHLLYMEKQEHSPAHATAIHRANLFAVRVFGNAVTAAFLLFFVQDGKLQRVQIPFDRDQRRHYEPMIRWCLRLDEDFDLSSTQVSLPNALLAAHPALCTLAAESALLGRPVGNTTWWPIKTGSLLHSRKPGYACLTLPMQRGLSVAYTHGEGFNLWLIFHGRGSAEAVQADGNTQSLVIKINGETISTVEHLLSP